MVPKGMTLFCTAFTRPVVMDTSLVQDQDPRSD